MAVTLRGVYRQQHETTYPYTTPSGLRTVRKYTGNVPLHHPSGLRTVRKLKLNKNWYFKNRKRNCRYVRQTSYEELNVIQFQIVSAVF